MQIIDRGSGPALVLIPGLQGRWEYLRPAVDALSASFRVLTFSLDGDKVRLKPDTTYGPAKPDAAVGLDRYAEHVATVMTGAGVERATICGVSFGGLVAVRFAAQNPARCDALILASTPRPALRLRPRHRMYVRAPWIFGPLFLAETPWRLLPEIRSAIPDALARRQFSLRALRTLFDAPLSLSQMAARAKMISNEDMTPDCARITAPTLVVTGEGDLDHVVPVEGSFEYVRLIPNARAVVLKGTGHLGSITRPDAFAALVREFTVNVGADLRVPPPHGFGEARQSAKGDGGRPGPTHASAPTGRVA
jgi:pimeloyl-ACP methyl ester carboxylesterase